MLPQSTYLGDLIFLEIYQFFDMPALFACSNKAGQVYIAVWVDESDNDTQWLYVPVSLPRFLTMRSGQLDLNDIFLSAEDGYVFLATVSYESKEDTIKELPLEELNEDMVPMPESYIKDVSKLPEIIWDSIDQRSGSSNIIDKWLSQHNYGQKRPSVELKFVPLITTEIGDGYFEKYKNIHDPSEGNLSRYFSSVGAKDNSRMYM